MLSKEDNELMRHIGPGTPMGNLLRQYWMPFIRSEDLEADGAPKRVKLLGEDLIAFRESTGQVGLIQVSATTYATHEAPSGPIWGIVSTRRHSRTSRCFRYPRTTSIRRC